CGRSLCPVARSVRRDLVRSAGLLRRRRWTRQSALLSEAASRHDRGRPADLLRSVRPRRTPSLLEAPAVSDRRRALRDGVRVPVPDLRGSDALPPRGTLSRCPRLNALPRIRAAFLGVS